MFPSRGLVEARVVLPSVRIGGDVGTDHGNHQEPYGYGRLGVNALVNLDYPMILGTTVIGAALVMLANLITDLIYPFLDPRVVYD